MWRERERDLFIYRIFASVTYIASGYIEKELRAHFRIKLMDRERFRIKEGFRGIKVLLYYHFADNYIVGMNGKRCRCNNAILRFFLPGKNISSGRNLSLSLSPRGTSSKDQRGASRIIEEAVDKIKVRVAIQWRIKKGNITSVFSFLADIHVTFPSPSTFSRTETNQLALRRPYCVAVRGKRKREWEWSTSSMLSESRYPQAMR